MKMVETYAYKKLKQKAGKSKRHVYLPGMNEILKVGVLWQPDYYEAYKYHRQYFSHTRVIFRNLCVYDDNEPEQVNSNSVTKKDLNWMGLPKSGITENFIQTDFDLLFNVALQQNLVLDYITALSQAKFKIGWSPEEDNFFDLNINISRNPDALYLAEQQIFYLGQLNKNKTQ